MVKYLLLFLMSYLLGAIPTAFIVGKMAKGIDIRQHGSGNIGTTNAFRVLGIKPALMVLVVDIIKGFLGVKLGFLLIGTEWAAIFGGISAVAGHNWPIYLRFKGGKGVATACGVIIALAPKVILLLILIWVVIIWITKYVSLASVIAAFSAPIAFLLFKQPVPYVIFSFIVAAFVIYRHRTNIQRLLKGQEAKVTDKINGIRR